MHPTLQPDLTIVIDLDPRKAAARRSRARAADRFESEEVGFFERVRGMYLERADLQQHRFLVIDGERTSAEIQRQILERLSQWHA